MLQSAADQSIRVEYAASVIPGLEDIAAEEIKARWKDDQVIEKRRGWLVFRHEGDAAELLRLRTTEDVFAILFRTAALPPYRKGAIPLLAQMAQRSRYWEQAMTTFRQARQRPVRRVTFRVVAQMTGGHGFRRQEVRDAVLSGVQSRWGGWKQVSDDAHLEVWVPVVGEWALIAIRLSTRKMRHRTYKEAHLPASLRPTLAAAMVMLSRPRPADRFCDPMCGAGTILAERALAGPCQALLGGDVDPEALQAAMSNLPDGAGGDRSRSHKRPRAAGSDDPAGAEALHLWDARALPLRSGSLDVVVCNLPFGKKVGTPASNPALYERFWGQLIRVLRPGGRAVLLSAEKELVHQLLERYPQLERRREVLVGILGQAARIYVLSKR